MQQNSSEEKAVRRVRSQWVDYLKKLGWAGFFFFPDQGVDLGVYLSVGQE